VTSKNREIRLLALEVLEDAEMSRTSIEALVLKAARLARLVGDEEIITWLTYERLGYNRDEIAIAYLGYTSRWIDPARTELGAYWGPIGEQEALLDTLTHRLEVIKNFRPSGEYAGFQFQGQQTDAARIGNEIRKVRRIVSAVRSLVQTFAATIYYEKLFSLQAETIFTQYQDAVDALLAATAKTAFDRLPQAFERLGAGDPEAISHALTTCRRVIDSFADAVYPPRPDPVLIGEQEIDVGAPHTKNRLRAYVHDRIGRGSRYDRLSRGLGSLYERVCAGVHADVDVGEARALVLQTYLFLGEVLILPSDARHPG
jgi:hypothetical protein